MIDNRYWRCLAMAPAALALAGCGFDSAFIAGCEKAIIARLRSPATYTRQNVIQDQERIPIDEYLASETSESIRRFRRKMAKSEHAVRHIAVFEYAAANAYGTSITSRAKCTYDTEDGDASRADEFTVKIDGMR